MTIKPYFEIFPAPSQHSIHQLLFWQRVEASTVDLVGTGRTDWWNLVDLLILAGGPLNIRGMGWCHQLIMCFFLLLDSTYEKKKSCNKKDELNQRNDLSRFFFKSWARNGEQQQQQQQQEQEQEQQQEQQQQQEHGQEQEQQQRRRRQRRRQRRQQQQQHKQHKQHQQQQQQQQQKQQQQQEVQQVRLSQLTVPIGTPISSWLVPVAYPNGWVLPLPIVWVKSLDNYSTK